MHTQETSPGEVELHEGGRRWGVNPHNQLCSSGPVLQSYLPLVYLGVGGTVLDMVNGEGQTSCIPATLSACPDYAAL